MLSPINNALLFLINTLFDLYLIILMARVILCWNRANYFNPITQIIINLTQPLVAPLRRVLPTYKGIEFSSLVLIILLEILKFFLASLLAIGMPKNPLGLLLLASADTLKLLLNTFFYAIFLQAILSWFHQQPTPLTQLLSLITAPILRPFQRIIPPISGFDASPIVALILLQLIIILLVTPLLGAGMNITFG